MKIVKIYRADFIGKWQRDNAEIKLRAQGYKTYSEEEVKEWDGGQACCLLILFFPLVFFAKIKKIKVTYTND